MDVGVNKIFPDNAVACASTPESSRDEIFLQLIRIIEQRQLTPNFQPNISMSTGEIFAYEGLIRGPSNSPLHS
ncbi:MAG: diguanylate cyclase, partial [Pseudomonadota bacterium]